jgi:hypothetical protein
MFYCAQVVELHVDDILLKWFEPMLIIIYAIDFTTYARLGLVFTYTIVIRCC